jgi:adenine-specific DNA-methyltransferase
VGYLNREFGTPPQRPKGAIDQPAEQVPFRPVQYLGNKLRALEAILDATEELVPSRGYVVDLFTGTTVVAQGFASRGHRVTAVDTQRYAVVFADALLGVGRQRGESCSFATLSSAGITSPIEGLRRTWIEFIEGEERALAYSDAAALTALSAQFPLLWRDAGQQHSERIESSARRCALGEIALLTSIYAGSYFGARQALILDELRQNAALSLAHGRISKWQYQAALSAIMCAASAAVHSAGKHFAQPLNSGSLRNERFLAARLLQDRNVDVEDEFAAACDAIDAQAVLADGGHKTWLGPAENFVACDGTADLYYLDPPYTAQQYSRFYHVLETICTYEYPKLFENGLLTTGLYPANRYKSAFSSKRKARPAFQTIVEKARASGTALVISYSQSAAGSRGNARMIALDELLDLCALEFGHRSVECYQLRHRYRQFNSASASNAQRDDPELLITCKPR